MNYKPFPNLIFRFPALSYTNVPSLLLTDLTKEAIFIASSALHDELNQFSEEKTKDNKKAIRIINSTTRYVSRMSTRCTPFGLFAGCSIGYIGDHTNISLECSFRRTSRLDMYYLCALYDLLVKKDGIRYKIKYFPNTSLYPIGKKMRYIEIKYTNGERKYEITEIDKSSYLNSILKKAKKGIYIPELMQLLVNESITANDAIQYINKLIESQILVGGLSNSVTGEDFLSCLIKMLKEIGYNGKELSTLVDINHSLNSLDNNSEININLYKHIIEKVRNLNFNIEKKDFFQVDMIRNTNQAVLGKDVVVELTKAMTFLNKITPRVKNEMLVKFQEEFYNRYGEREIPLMEALDPELGIGYPSKNNGDITPLLNNFLIPQKPVQEYNIQTSFISLLTKKTIECLKEKYIEIRLCDDDVKNSYLNWSDLPPTIYTLFEIISSKCGNLLIKTSAFSGSCGANLLGRFAHTDTKIKEFVENIAKKEQELMPDAILAEIVHLPESRVGNILFRPHIRNYELLYLSNSDLPQEQLIYVSDLMLSIKQGRLFIRSKRLNKEIIPRLTTAHNFRNSTMPVYKFLCDMQHPNGRNGLFFTWGHLEKELDFRPRVRYGNTILSPASWTIKTKDISHLFNIQADDELLTKITEWRNSLSLPQKILMPDGDNELYVDFGNALSIKALFSIIKKRQRIKLEEFLHDEKNPVVLGPDGNYLNECIVAFYKSE